MTAAGSDKFYKRDLRGINYGGPAGDNINHLQVTMEIVIKTSGQDDERNCVLN